MADVVSRLLSIFPERRLIPIAGVERKGVRMCNVYDIPVACY